MHTCWKPRSSLPGRRKPGRSRGAGCIRSVHGRREPWTDCIDGIISLLLLPRASAAHSGAAELFPSDSSTCLASPAFIHKLVPRNCGYPSWWPAATPTGPRACFTGSLVMNRLWNQWFGWLVTRLSTNLLTENVDILSGGARKSCMNEQFFCAVKKHFEINGLMGFSKAFPQACHQKMWIAAAATVRRPVPSDLFTKNGHKPVENRLRSQSSH